MMHMVGLANFKSFGPERTDFSLGRITVLIGPNGTGKSSLLQALLLLKQSAMQRQLNYAGPLIDLGSFRDLVHDQDIRQKVTFRLSGERGSSALPDTAHDVPRLTFYYETTLTENGVGDQLLVLEDVEHQNIIFSSDSLGNSQPISLGGKMIYVVKSTAFADPVGLSNEANLSNSQLDPRVQLLSPVPYVLSNYFLVPAIRGFGSRTYNIINSPPPSDLNQTDRTMDQQKIVANLIANHPDIVDRVSGAINCILGRDVLLRHRLHSNSIVPEVRKNKLGISLSHEAFGLNQLVAPLLSFFSAPPDSVIAIEEPEIHLHPRAQAAMSHFFARSVNQEEKQLILTTHSEHILMGFLTAVANGDLKSDDLAIYELRADDGTTTATRLTVNEYGQIEGGLRGFMEVDLDEIGDFIKARIAHQTQ